MQFNPGPSCINEELFSDVFVETLLSRFEGTLQFWSSEKVKMTSLWIIRNSFFSLIITNGITKRKNSTGGEELDAKQVYEE